LIGVGVSVAWLFSAVAAAPPAISLPRFVPAPAASASISRPMRAAEEAAADRLPQAAA
jgi:hypothetical protein